LNNLISPFLPCCNLWLLFLRCLWRCLTHTRKAFYLSKAIFWKIWYGENQLINLSNFLEGGRKNSRPEILFLDFLEGSGLHEIWYLASLRQADSES